MIVPIILLKYALRITVVIFMIYSLDISEYTIAPQDGACDQDRWVGPLTAHQTPVSVSPHRACGASPGILGKIFGTRGWVWNSGQILGRIGTNPLVPLLARLWAPLLVPIGTNIFYSVDENCRPNAIVYKATVTTNDETETMDYLGST